MRRLFVIPSLFSGLDTVSAGQAQNTNPSRFNVLIRHGKIVDGFGKLRYEADISDHGRRQS